jgi:hypothetical protein
MRGWIGRSTYLATALHKKLEPQQGSMQADAWMVSDCKEQVRKIIGVNAVPWRLLELYVFGFLELGLRKRKTYPPFEGDNHKGE